MISDKCIARWLSGQTLEQATGGPMFPTWASSGRVGRHLTSSTLPLPDGRIVVIIVEDTNSLHVAISLGLGLYTCSYTCTRSQVLSNPGRWLPFYGVDHNLRTPVKITNESKRTHKTLKNKINNCI